MSEYIPEYLQDEPVMDPLKEDIKYIPIGYQYINDVLCLLAYNTNTDNIAVFPKDKDHNPYILSRDTVIKPSKGIIRVVNMDKFVATRGAYQPFKQVVLVTPNDATYISKKLRTAWENHIRYHECYVYDKQLVFGVPAENKEGSLVPTFRFQGDLKEYLDKILSIEFIPIRRCALDIEVRAIGGKFADPETAEFPIIDFSIVGNDGKSWLLFTGPRAYKLGAMECFVEEADMVRRGFEIIEKEGYPIIITKNGDGYDFPYLANRCLKIGVPCPIFQKLKYWSWNNKIHIDIERFFGNSTIKKEIFKNRYDDNSLEELVEKLLVGKRKLASPDFGNDSAEKIGYYCLNDCEVTLELTTFDNDYVMRMIILISRICNMDLEDTTRVRISSWITSYYQFFHRLLNYLIPNGSDLKHETLQKELEAKAKELGARSAYRGAIIIPPIVGYHYNCRIGDYGSLYPSCIQKNNISYDTVQCSHEECKTNLVPELGFHICTKRIGVLPLIFGSIKDLRLGLYKPRMRVLERLSENKEVSSLDNDDKWFSYVSALDSAKKIVELAWYKAIVDTLRILINAGYGVFGDDDLESLFCYPVPAAVAAYARRALTYAKERAEGFYHAIILAGHTDSLIMKNISEETMKELAEDISKELDIDFEDQGHFLFVSLWRKGNYLTVNDDKKVEVKGLMGKKRHVPRFLKNRFNDLRKIVSEIKDEPSRIDANIKIALLLKSSKEAIMGDKVPIEDLAWSIQLGKEVDEGTGQIYDAARYIKEQGLPVAKGDRIKVIKTNSEVCGYTALPIQFVKDPSWIDKIKIIELMGNIYNQVLEPMGLDTDELLDMKKPPKPPKKERVPKKRTDNIANMEEEPKVAPRKLESFFGAPKI